jgi:hypothetical protein
MLPKLIVPYKRPLYEQLCEHFAPLRREPSSTGHDSSAVLIG